MAEMLRRLFYTGAAATGVGIAGRALATTPPLKSKPVQIPFVSPGPSVVPIRLPGTPGDEEEAVKLAQMTPAAPVAEPVASQPAEPAPPTGDWFHNNVLLPIAQHIPQDSLTKTVENIANSPWAAGGRLAVPAAGLIGGWKLADWLLDRRQKGQSTDELGTAKQEYEAALMGKTATAEKLDKVASLMLASKPACEEEKQANLADVVGPYVGVGTLLGGGAIAGGAALGYKYRRDNSRSKMIEKALQNRARMLWNKQLQPVQFVPQEQAAATGL